MAEYAAYFYDGASAKRHQVWIAVRAQEVEIRYNDGGMLHSWPTAELWAPERFKKGAPLSLACRAAGDARLVIADERCEAALRAAAPRLFRRFSGGLDRVGHIVIAGAIAIALMLGAFFFWPEATQKVAALIPQSWQEQLGDNVQAGLTGMAARCEVPRAVAAIEQLAQRLSAASATAIAVKITMVESEIVNAFAAPGGRIVFFSGILEKMAGPDEFAAVLAHEMAHVRENHPMVGVVRMLGLDILLAILIGDNSAVAETIGQAGALLALFAYSREAEAEADRIGFEMLAAAGISPAALGRFFARLQTGKDGDEKVSGLAHYLSTHPAPAARIASAAAFAQSRRGERRPALSAEQWQAVQAMCSAAE